MRPKTESALGTTRSTLGRAAGRTIFFRHETLLLAVVVGEWCYFNAVGTNFPTLDNTFDIVRRQPGRLSGEFFFLYAVVRIIGERFREPDSDVSLILGLSRGTFYSIFLVGIGLWLCLRRKSALGTTRSTL